MTQIPKLDRDLRDDKGELVLRRATSDDRERAFEIQRAAFRTYVDKNEGWDEQAQRLLHERNFKLYDYRMLVLHGAVIGTMSLDLTDCCIKVNRLFIEPGHQGCGIGERCMDVLISEANRLRLPMRLRVMKVNPRAVSFYERLDFHVTKVTDTHFDMEKQPGAWS